MKRRNIRKKLAGAAIYSCTLVRVRHYRGRKVHSPFVYGIVRNAIMKTRPDGGDEALFDDLRARGFSVKRAAQLQNLYTFRGFTSAVFAEGGNSLSTVPDAGTLCFAMPSMAEDDIRAMVEKVHGTGATVCVVSPYGSRGRYRLARHLVETHRHTSVDNRGFLLLFFDERLPKQHFKL